MLAPMTTAWSLVFTLLAAIGSRVPSTVRSNRSDGRAEMANRWRTKSVEQSIADTDEPDTRLRKELTWRDLTVFGVAVVIGAGIFTVTASTTGDITGPAIWISFVIAAITCALAALCYAEFASTLPVAGSAYTFSYATFGEFLAWIIGWNLVLELAIGAAVVSKGWSSYLGTVFGFAGGTVQFGSVNFDWGALLIVAGVSVLIALGTKVSSRVSAVITAIKVSVVMLVVVVGAFYIKSANYSPFIPKPETGKEVSGNQPVGALAADRRAQQPIRLVRRAWRAHRSCSSRSSVSTSWRPWPRRPRNRSATSRGEFWCRWRS